MKKINIIKENYDFNRIITNFKPFRSKYFYIFKENVKDSYHFGFSISKKTGNAVKKNKLKRQIKSILDQFEYNTKFNCIIMAKKNIFDVSYQDLEKDLVFAIKKLNLEGEKNEK